MRVLFPLAVAFALAPIARADDGADAKAIVEEAVKAAGMKPDERMKAMTWREKGKFPAGEFTLEFNSQTWFQGPDKYKFDMDGTLQLTLVRFLVIVNGTRACEVAQGKAREMEGEKLEFTLTKVYQLHVWTLVPLLSDPDFKLTTAGEKDVNGKKAALVRVTRAKRPDIMLYFDKATGFLVKSDTKVKDEFRKFKLVLEEVYFDDYKEVDGKKFHTKMKLIHDGETLMESTLYDRKFVDKLDPKLFEALR